MVLCTSTYMGGDRDPRLVNLVQRHHADPHRDSLRTAEPKKKKRGGGVAGQTPSIHTPCTLKYLLHQVPT
jgi:hypothetical protein